MLTQVFLLETGKTELTIDTISARIPFREFWLGFRVPCLFLVTGFAFGTTGVRPRLHKSEFVDPSITSKALNQQRCVVKKTFRQQKKTIS